MMDPTRRRRLASIVIPAIVGLTALLTVIGRPRFQAYHTVDALELVASGLCFGIAFVGLVRVFRGAEE
jgi:ABC-type nickel/cobalt efflux system permease component RcnA